MKNKLQVLSRLVGLAAALLLAPALVLPHCDSMDGPVVKAAIKALESGDVKLVLVWVQSKDEKEIKKAFQKTLSVRKGGPEAQELADMYFFETLVRLHRAGEGAPYTGLKPAGTKVGPAILAADKVLESGQADELMKLLTDEFQKRLADLFKKANSKKGYKPANVEGGRLYVRAYIELLHYVERLHEAATAPVKGYFPEH